MDRRLFGSLGKHADNIAGQIRNGLSYERYKALVQQTPDPQRTE